MRRRRSGATCAFLRGEFAPVVLPPPVDEPQVDENARAGMRAYARAYRELNRDAILSYRRAYYRANREHILAQRIHGWRVRTRLQRPTQGQNSEDTK